MGQLHVQVAAVRWGNYMNKWLLSDGATVCTSHIEPADAACVAVRDGHLVAPSATCTLLARASVPQPNAELDSEGRRS
jgi:hypothetical protein